MQETSMNELSTKASPSKKRPYEFRKLADLNLIDNFLFQQLLSDEEYGPEFARILLQTFLGRQIRNVKNRRPAATILRECSAFSLIPTTILAHFPITHKLHPRKTSWEWTPTSMVSAWTPTLKRFPGKRNRIGLMRASCPLSMISNPTRQKKRNPFPDACVITMG